MRRKTLRPVFVLLACAALGAAGCAQQSQPSDFYLLSYETPQPEPGKTTTMREGPALGIGPIEFPQYLDRPQIVTRDGTNQLVIQEFSRWGGRLKESFTTVLTQALSAELETDRVSIYPWNLSAPIEYQVTVQVFSFDSDADGRSTLDARWSVVEVKSQKVLTMARSTYREVAETGIDEEDDGVDYEAVAAAMSKDVAALAREIAAQIKSAASL